MRIVIKSFAYTKAWFGTAPKEKGYRGRTFAAEYDDRFHVYKVETPNGPLHVHPLDVEVSSAGDYFT